MPLSRPKAGTPAGASLQRRWYGVLRACTTIADRCSASSCRTLRARLSSPAKLSMSLQPCSSAARGRQAPRCGAATRVPRSGTATWRRARASRRRSRQRCCACRRCSRRHAPYPAALHGRRFVPPAQGPRPGHARAATLATRPARRAGLGGGAWLPAPPGSTCHPALWRVRQGEVSAPARALKPLRDGLVREQRCRRGVGGGGARASCGEPNCKRSPSGLGAAP